MADLTPPDSTTPFQPTRPVSAEPPLSVEERSNRQLTLLAEIRDGIDRGTRHEQYQELSLGRLLGGIAQVVALGLAALAVLEWFLQGATDVMYARLAFAGFAQLVALTGFSGSHERRH